MSEQGELPPPPPEEEDDVPPPPAVDDDDEDDDEDAKGSKFQIVAPPAPATEFDMTEEQAQNEGRRQLAATVWKIAKSTQDDFKEEAIDAILTVKALYAVAIMFYECANQDNESADMLDVEWAEKDTPAIVEFAKETGAEIKDTYTTGEIRSFIVKKIDNMIAAGKAEAVVPPLLQFATNKVKTDMQMCSNQILRESMSFVSLDAAKAAKAGLA